MKKTIFASVILILSSLAVSAQGKNFVNAFSIGENIDKYINFVEKSDPKIPDIYNDMVLEFNKNGQWVDMQQQMWTVTDKEQLQQNGFKLNSIYMFTLDNTIFAIAYTAPGADRDIIYKSIADKYGNPTFSTMTFGRIFGWETPKAVIEMNYSGTVDGVTVSIVDKSLVRGKKK